MVHRRIVLRIATLILASAFLFGCNIGALFNPTLEPPATSDNPSPGDNQDTANDNPDGSPGGGDSNPISVTARTLSTELSAALTTETMLTEAEVAAVLAAAEREVGDLDSFDIASALPLLVAGAQQGIGALPGLSDDDRLELVRLIAKQAARSIRGRHDLLALSGSSSRGLDPNAAALENILSKIARASVANINRTGISSTRVSEAAGAATSSLVSSLGDGGLRKEHLNRAVQEIARGAVQGLTESGLTEDEAIKGAVERIAEGATEGVSALRVDGVEDRDLPSLVSEVASGATSGAESLASDETSFSGLIEKVTAGAAKGVEKVKTARQATIQAADVEGMVAGIAAGATRGVKSATIVNLQDTTTTKSVITTITESTSRAVSTLDLSGVTGLSTDGALQKVARGAAAGAQELSDTGMSEADLADAIVIVKVVDPTTNTEEAVDPTTYTDEITEGRAEGTNTPPSADAGADVTTSVDETVTITGVASDTEDDPSQLVVRWTIIGRPVDSTAVLSDAGTVTVSFVPDVDGTFELNFVVQDSGGKAAESAVLVIVNPPAEDPTYGGRTAEQRLADAQQARAERRHADAVAEYRTLIQYYPLNEFTPEAYLGLGWAYSDTGNHQAALATFEEARSMHTAGEAFFTAEVYADATLGAGTKLLWNLNRAADAKAYFDEIYAGFPGTTLQASALHGQAAYDLFTGSYAESRTKHQDLIDNYPASNNTLFWSRHDIAQSYRRQGDYDNALAQFDAMLADETKLHDNEGLVSQRFLGRAMLEKGHILRQAGRFGEAITAFGAAESEARLHVDDRALAQKMIGDTYLWDLDDDLSAIAAYDSLESTYAPDPANPAPTNPWMIAYGALNRGHARRGIAEDTPFGLERETAFEEAIAAFQYVVDTFPVDRYYQAGLWAQVHIGEILTWDLPNRLADARNALLDAIDGVRDGHSREVEAQAIYGIGNTYMREAYDAENDYTTDHVALFLTAVDYFEQVHPGNFPNVRPDRWFFREAPAKIAEAYIGIGRYADARAYIASLLTDTETYDVGRRARLQREYGRSYAEEYWEAERNHLLAEMEALLPLAITAFEAVETYQNEDGTLADNGHPWANSLLRIAELNREHGKHYRHHEDDPTSAEPYFNAALAAAGRVTTTAFPAIDTNDWYFRRAREIEADVYGELGRYDDARTALAAVRTAAESAGDYGTAAWAQFEIGRWFREEAEWTDVFDLSSYNHAVTLLESARSALAEVKNITESDGVTYPDDGRPAAEAQIELGETYDRQAGLLQHDSNQDFGAIATELQGLYIDAIQAFTLIVGDPGNGGTGAPQNGIAADPQMLAADNGRFAAAAQRRLGWANFNAIMSFHWQGQVPKTDPTYQEYLTYALDAFLAVDDYGSADEHDVARARLGEIRTRLAFGDAANIEIAENLVWASLSDPAFDDEDIARILVTFAETLVWDHQDIIAEDSSYALGGSNDWAITAELMLETVTDSYATVDGGHEAARATELLGELYRSVAEYREDEGDTARANARWQNAVDTFTALATGFGHVDDEYTGIGNLRLGFTYVDWAYRSRERGEDSTADSLFALAVTPLETTRDFYEWIWDGNGGFDARRGLGEVFASRGSIALAASDFVAAETYLTDAVTVQTEIIDTYEGVVWDDAIGRAYYQRADARVELGLIETDSTVADAYFDDAIADFVVARDSYGHTNGGAMAGDAQNRIDEAVTYRDNN